MSALPLLAANNAPAILGTVIAKTGWSPAAVGIWSILLVQLFILGGVIVKKGPDWIKAFSDSRKAEAEVEAADRGERDKREEAIEERVKVLENRTQRAENINMYLIGATTMALNALRAAAPHDPAIAQATSLVEMAVAAGGDGVFAKSLAQLAQMRGAGE